MVTFVSLCTAFYAATCFPLWAVFASTACMQYNNAGRPPGMHIAETMCIAPLVTGMGGVLLLILDNAGMKIPFRVLSIATGALCGLALGYLLQRASPSPSWALGVLVAIITAITFVAVYAEFLWPRLNCT